MGYGRLASIQVLTANPAAANAAIERITPPTNMPGDFLGGTCQGAASSMIALMGRGLGEWSTRRATDDLCSLVIGLPSGKA